jgi:hypothetical protein
MVGLVVLEGAQRGRDVQSVEIQTDLSLATRFKPPLKSVGTLTTQDTVIYESDFDRWWQVCNWLCRGIGPIRLALTRPRCYWNDSFLH